MSQNGNFNFTDHTGFDNFGIFGGSNDEKNAGFFDLQSYQDAGPSNIDNPWYLRAPEVGGTSQPYKGAEVSGDLSYLDSPTTAPISLYPGNGVPLDDGYDSHFRQGAVVPQPEKIADTVPVLSPDIETLRWLGPSGEVSESRIEVSDLDPLAPFSLNLEYSPVPDTVEPEVPLPAPVASSSVPQRTSKRLRKKRESNSIKPAKKRKKIDKDGCENEGEDGWNAALCRFQTIMHDTVFNGQPSGRLSPEMALAAKIVKIAKEELKRSPLQGSKAGEGKRCRNLEDYLAGILGELIPVPTTDGSRSNKVDSIDFMATLADTLEARLVAVNESSTLRKPWVPRSTPVSEIEKEAHREQTDDRAKKRQRERVRREGIRSHLERISCLFKVQNSRQTWTRTEVLSFALLFLLWGQKAFSPGFVRVASA